MSASIVRRSCVQDGVCLCSRTWVLVIHNDFEGMKKFKRLGDDVDVKNLRRVFETQRGCTFRELHNRGSEEIVQTLAQEERLMQLFHSNDLEDPLSCPPAAFILFILSHGESGGVILTDHFQKDSDPADFKFETYSTNDVWKLSKMDLLASTLKILFLGPCRGNLAEFKLIDKDMKKRVQTLPGWLSSQPNKENFVILYATVESTMAHRCEADGTWFVEAICKELENLTENLSLLVFLTRIQFHLCTKNTFGASYVGQTSQLHFFYHEVFTMCAAKYISTANWPSKSQPPIQELTDNISQTEITSKCTSLHWTYVAYDTKAGNLEGLVKSFDTRFTYEWLDQRGHQLNRGKALIFHDRTHYACAVKMGISLQGLDYKISLSDVLNLNSLITKKNPKKGFQYDGSFVLCVLAQISESENGLVIKQANKTFLLSKIIDEYTGTKCTQLIGKPKLFFFLDDGVKSDGELKVENEKEKMDTYGGYKYFNLHAGVCTFVGVRCGPKGSGGDVVENLIQELRSPRLKEEGSNLQTVLSEVITKAAVDDKQIEDDTDRIKPQFLSTLPQLVNFPPLHSPYKQENSSVLHQILRAVALMSIIFALTLIIILGFQLRSPRLLLVNVEDSSCMVSIEGSSIEKNDAFSLNSSEWSNIYTVCNDTWRQTYASDYVIVDYLTDSDGSSMQIVVDALEKGENKRESLYRIILFGYTSANLLKMIQFPTSLNSLSLQLDGFRCIVAKIATFQDFENIAVLELAHNVLFSKEIDEIFQDLVMNWSMSIITRICFDMTKSDFILFDSIKTLSVGTQTQFVPMIITQCARNITLNDFTNAMYQTQKLYPKLACSSYYMLMLEMSNQIELGSARAFKLRIISGIYATYSSPEEEKQKCLDVVEKLKVHIHEHAQPFLQLYDNLSLANQCGNFSLVLSHHLISKSELNLIVPYLVEVRYNGSLENIVKLLKCFNDTGDPNFVCAGTMSLIKEFHKYKKGASFDSLHTYAMLNSFGLKNLTICKKSIIDLVPMYIQQFLLDTQYFCDDDYGDKTLFCTENAIYNMDSIVADFETRNLTKRREILFVIYVLDSITVAALMKRSVSLKIYSSPRCQLNLANNIFSNESYCQTGKIIFEQAVKTLRKTTLLSSRVEPFKEEILETLACSFSGNFSTNEDDDIMTIEAYFGPRVLNKYLPEIVRKAYLLRGIDGMPNYLDNLDLLYKFRNIWCNGVDALHSAMQPKDFYTTEAFFFWTYAYAWLKITNNDGNSNSQNSKMNDNYKCSLVLNMLNSRRNYTITGMNEYEFKFLANDSESLNVIVEWQNKYKYSSFWIIPQLIEKLRYMYKSFEFPILHLLKQFPSDINRCIGLKALSDEFCCSKFNYRSCAYFTKEMCKIIPAANNISLGKEHYLQNMCIEVKQRHCNEHSTYNFKYLCEF